MIDANIAGTVSDLMVVKDNLSAAHDSLCVAQDVMTDTKILVDGRSLAMTLRVTVGEIEKAMLAIQGHIDAIVTASYTKTEDVEDPNFGPDRQY